MEPGIGLYLHLPFCLSKCAYCDFASFPLASLGGLDFARGYVEALLAEIDRRAVTTEFAGAVVDTVFFGGGTPTVLPGAWLAELLQRVRNRFAVEASEISVEANPGTVGEEVLGELRAAGVSRLSMGVQSFSDESLRLLGRAHGAAEADQAFSLARTAGFDNVSLDLIYGLPGQTVAQWREDLLHALELRPEHLSAYGLSLEEGTPLTEAVACGRLPAPEEEPYAEMYALTHEVLTAAGYQHYEISNYALPGRECRHNRKYWAGDEYLGVGSGAHSHRGGLRWNNVSAPQLYRESLANGLWPVARAEVLSPRARVGELLMLGLRTADGVSETDVAARTGLAPREVFGEQIARLLDRGLLEEDAGRLTIPPAQWLVSNEVLAEFVGE